MSIQIPDYQRGFTEALRWARSKVSNRKTIQEAVSVLSEAIGNLEHEQISNMDQALMILE